MSDIAKKRAKIFAAQILAFLTSSYLVNYVFIGQTPIVRPSVTYSFAQLPNRFAATVRGTFTPEKKSIVSLPQSLETENRSSDQESEIIYPTIPPSVNPERPVLSVPPNQPSFPTEVPSPTLFSPPPNISPTKIATLPPTQPPLPAAPENHPQAPNQVPTEAPAAQPPANTSTFEQEIVSLINSKRGADHLRNLSVNAQLTTAARRESTDNARKSSVYECSHTGSDGSDFISRARDAGFAGRVYGETIGCGHQSAQSIVDAWWSSPQHHDILTNGQISIIGVGWVVDKQTAQTAVVGF